MNYEDKPPGGSAKNKNFLPEKVGIIYSDVKKKYFPTKEQFLTEKDAYRDAKIIAGCIRRIGMKPVLFPGNSKLPLKLAANRPDVVLNLVASVKGTEWLASSIPAVLELLEIPYTGAGILGESLVYNKFLVKKILQQNGIPVPYYQLFNSDHDPLNPTLRFPLISKLNEIHGSVEITKDSVSENEKHLRQRLKFLITTYKQPVLVEEFIVGREISAVVLEGSKKKVYLAEKIFHEKTGNYSFASFEVKWLDEKNNPISYQKYKDPLLVEYVKRAFEITDMADYARFDIRIDQSGRYYFLDCNTNPYLAPKETGSTLACILDLYNLPFNQTLKRLLINSVRNTYGKKLLPITNGKGGK